MWMWVTRREEKVEDDWTRTWRGRLCKTLSTMMVIWISICKLWEIPGSSEWMKQISILERQISEMEGCTGRGFCCRQSSIRRFLSWNFCPPHGVGGRAHACMCSVSAVYLPCSGPSGNGCYLKGAIKMDGTGYVFVGTSSTNSTSRCKKAVKYN